MSCEYCKGMVELLNRIDKLSTKGDFNPGIVISIYEGTLCVQSVADTYEPNFTEAEVPIKFCPMCGDSLAEEE